MLTMGQTMRQTKIKSAPGQATTTEEYNYDYITKHD